MDTEKSKSGNKGKSEKWQCSPKSEPRISPKPLVPSVPWHWEQFEASRRPSVLGTVTAAVAAPLLALRAEAIVDRVSAIRTSASESSPPPQAAKFRISARAPSARPMSCRLGIRCLLKGRSWPVGFTQIAQPGSCDVRLKKSLSKSWLFVTAR